MPATLVEGKVNVTDANAYNDFIGKTLETVNNHEHLGFY